MMTITTKSTSSIVSSSSSGIITTTTTTCLQMRKKQPKLKTAKEMHAKCVRNYNFIRYNKSHIMKRYEKITSNDDKISLSKIHNTIEYCSVEENSYYKTCTNVYNNINVLVDDKPFVSKKRIVDNMLYLSDRIELEEKYRNIVNYNNNDSFDLEK